MCIYADVIERVLVELLENGESFSAYDVTKRVRKIVGRGVDVKHGEVRTEVQSYMSGVDDYCEVFNGTYIVYEPLPEIDDEEEDDDHKSAADPGSSFGDQGIVMFPGEAVEIKFDQPVSGIKVQTAL